MAVKMFYVHFGAGKFGPDAISLNAKSGKKVVYIQLKLIRHLELLQINFNQSFGKGGCLCKPKNEKRSKIWS